MSDKRTSIKTTEAVRDRLKLLADERGTTITGLLEDFASRELTTTEREARAQAAIKELHDATGYTVTDADRARARDFIAALENKSTAA